jgi:hypothetical protein
MRAVGTALTGFGGLLLGGLLIGRLAYLGADGPGAPGAGPAVPAVRFLGPRVGPEKAKALARFGGDAATEKAVAAGLGWLARHADEDGWDADGFPARCAKGGAACDGIGKGQHGEAQPCPFDAAISALAVQAFVGAGHGPWVEGDPHGPLVERALGRLRTRQHEYWALPLATQALAEAEALEKQGRWMPDARAGAAALLQARAADGAWGYAAAFRPGSDVPYSALVVPALLAARDVGVELPATLGADVDRWLGTLESDEGRLAYLRVGRKYGYTPTAANAIAAAALREWLETGRQSAQHRGHLSRMTKQRPDWSISFKELDVPGRGKQRVQIGTLSLYDWWYGTMAAFQVGGETWSAWNGRLKSELVTHQRKDGCAAGSWDPLGTYERQTGGRVFATALAVLMLETPYRHRRLAEK